MAKSPGTMVLLVSDRVRRPGPWGGRSQGAVLQPPRSNPLVSRPFLFLEGRDLIRCGVLPTGNGAEL